jgi:hypothetical protein
VLLAGWVVLLVLHRYSIDGNQVELSVRGEKPVAVTGRKPKPRDQVRNRVKPVHDWTEVPNVPNGSGPKLPAAPGRPAAPEPPEPPRPLGSTGIQLWQRAWRSSTTAPDVDILMQLCEQCDERIALRVRVLRDNDPQERCALRALDKQVAQRLVLLAESYGDPTPSRWPSATRRWWRAISRLPHAALWTDADWQFALDTAQLVAAFHAGDHRLAVEIRRRERVMGTTADARRDLRIRYVDASPVETHDPSVTAMADYRRSVSAT